MARWLMDPDDELRWVDSLSRGRGRAKAAADAWSNSEALYAAQIARMAPWLGAGTVLALAQGHADTRTVESAARAQAGVLANRPGAGQPWGSMMTGANLTPGHRDLFKQALANDAFHYVSGQIQRGAEARTRQELRNEGILDAEGGLHSPVSVKELNRYRRNPGAYASSNPAQAARIERFIRLTQQLGGGEGEHVGPYGGPMPRTDWMEIPFRTPEGPGQYRPPTSQGAGGFFEPEPGVEAQSVSTGLGEILHRIGNVQLPSYTSHIPGVEGAERTAGPTSLSDVARQSSIVLAAPLQEAEGQIRNVWGAAHGRGVDWFQPQSDLAIQWAHPDLESGHGWFVDPDSELGAERLRREQARGLLNGQVFTLGRFAASGLEGAGVIDIDTQPYRVLSGLVDAGKAIFLDPTALAAGRLAKVTEAQHIFMGGDEAREATGLLRGFFTPGVHGPTATAWLDSRIGRKVVEALAAEGSVGKIWRATGRKLETDEARALARAQTPAEVRDVLQPMLGKQFRSTKDVWQDPEILGMIRRPEMAMVPHAIQVDSTRSWMTQTERWMQGTRIDDTHQIEFLDRLGQAQSNNARWDVLTDIMTDRRGALAQAGVDSAPLRRQITRIFRDTQDDQRRWFVDEMGDNVSVWHDVAAGDDVIPGIGPHLSVEHISRTIPLPNYKEIKALTSRYPNLIKLAPDANGPLGVSARFPEALLSAWQNDIWKPFVLLRGAWPVRVIGEEQLRMAAAGLHAMFSTHPVSYASWAIGRSESGRITSLVEKAVEKIHVPEAVPVIGGRGIKRRGGFDVLGTPFEEADSFHSGLVSRGRAGGFLDEAPGRARTNRIAIFTKDDDDYIQAAADELAMLRNDPVSRKLTQSASLDEVEEWFVNGDGREVLDELIDSHPVLVTPGAPRRYLETVAHRIDVKTGGHTDLLDAIATGTYNGKRWLVDDLRPTGEFKQALQSDELFDALPQAVKGQDMVYLQNARSGIVGRGWRAATDWLFAGLMSRPTNYLSRSPVFRQFYWKRAEELISHGDETAKTVILAAAEKSNLSPGTMKRLRRVEARGNLNPDEIDALAKGWSLDETKNLLYDLAEKSQVADSMRLVAPFGEAWREVVTRWGQLANPMTARGIKNIRRFQQGVQAFRGEGLGEVMGAPEGKGFFWKNEFGEEVFIYPGSEWLTGTLTDAMGPRVPIPLIGRVQGLNMVGNVFPGVGPVAAIPVSWFLPNKPGLQRYMRELVLPYGAIGEEGDPAAMFQALSFAPAWMRTAFQAFAGAGFDQESNRIYANSTMKMASYLYSTGRYDTSTPQGKQKLLNDASAANRNFYAIRAMVAFGAPSAPSPDFLVKSSEGLVRWAMLRDELWNLREKLGLDEGDTEFLKRWGSDLGDNRSSVDLMLQSLSRSLTPGVEQSQDFEDWRAKNKDLVRDFPDIYALFGPHGGKPDYPAYVAQIKRGDRSALSLEDWFALSQNTLGWMQFNKAKAQMPDFPTDEDEQWLADIEDKLRDEYPGFKATEFIEGPADTKTLLHQLEKAVDDPRIKNTKAGKALTQYWGARQELLDLAKDMGFKTFNGKTFVNDRAWLHRIGTALAKEVPEFSPIWKYVLSREVQEEEE